MISKLTILIGLLVFTVPGLAAKKASKDCSVLIDLFDLNRPLKGNIYRTKLFKNAASTSSLASYFRDDEKDLVQKLFSDSVSHPFGEWDGTQGKISRSAVWSHITMSLKGRRLEFTEETENESGQDISRTIPASNPPIILIGASHTPISQKHWKSGESIDGIKLLFQFGRDRLIYYYGGKAKDWTLTGYWSIRRAGETEETIFIENRMQRGGTW